MKFTQSFLHLASCLALALVGSVAATNGTALNSAPEVILWNGSDNVSVTIGRSLEERQEGSGPPPWKRDSINCKGSSLCSGPLITAGQCQSAFNLIVASNTYNAGGSSSGTCSGHCGIFVQSYNGSGGCSVSGLQLQTSFNAIRAAGCAKCGSDEFDNGCEVTINYVGSC
ncbi:meiotically up-regulated gene family-domain-containing protein [Mycena vulgaris]|nr:meiotically up-regulated gene family-domain-containing protein [Mycena vulgaris]KAJ6605481.1 meiotically up-regulated gene family-domain-containing protein [Mycena vulgaris]